MSFKRNESQQLTLHDSFINMSPRSQKMLRNSWCQEFADIVFPAINEDRFSVLYSDQKFSRPNTPVNFIVGALMLKEEHGLSDEELVASICFDVRYQYALHTTQLEEQPVSDRTFSRFRERIAQFEQETGRNLLQEEMEQLNEVYAEYMQLKGNVKRMDSLMVASRCKRMTRLEIVYATCAKAVKLMHRLGADALLPDTLRHCLDEEDYNKIVYYCKGDDVESRLEQALQEANTIEKAMAGDRWHEHTEYQLLARVIREQADRKEDGSLSPYKDRCKAKEQRKDYAVHVSQKMADRANYLRKMSTEEYRKLARKRNAIEGIPSVLRRKYHIDTIPVLGKIRSKAFVICKVMAYNFNKLRKYMRTQRDNCPLLPITE